MRDLMKFMLSLVAMMLINVSANAWEFKSVTPAEGSVEEISALHFELPDGLKGKGFTTIPAYMWAELDGQEVAVASKSLDIMGEYFDVTFDKPMTSGTLVMKFGMGGNQLWGVDGAQFNQTFTWTIGKKTGGDYPFEFDYNKAEEKLSLTWPAGTTLAVKNGGATLEGFTAYFNLAPDFDPAKSNVLTAYVALADGDYTLHIPAGAYTVNGVDIEAYDVPFTVGSAAGGIPPTLGGGTSEVLFKKDDLGSKMIENISINGDGVDMTTEGFYNANLDFTVPVRYNQNEDGWINWNNGTKLIFTSKKDKITAIHIKGTSLEYASADKGEYKNGWWVGELAAGEAVTLTASDGLSVSDIIVHYNGGVAEEEDESNKPGVITVQWPTPNMPLASIANGGKLAEFTTTKEYAQVTIELRNTNPVYHNLYDLPIRMFDNAAEGSTDGLHVGSNTVFTQTPGETPWYTFKGDSYELIIKGFVNFWDVMPDKYDAMAVVPVVGDGIPHEAISAIKLVNINPQDGADIAEKNQIVTLQFDGAVKKLEAQYPQGMDGTKTFSAAPKAGTDNKVWEISLGDLSSLASSETESATIELDITARDNDDAVIAFSDDRSDRALVVKYNVKDDAPTTDAVVLGTPMFSVAEQAEISATTSSIKMTFPNATGTQPTYTVNVQGSISDKSFGSQNINANGTIGNGVDIAVSLQEDKAYNITITDITVSDGTKNVFAAHELNYYVNFYTKAAGTGGGGDELSLALTKVDEGAVYVQLTGVDAVIPELTADHMLTFGKVLENGVNNSFIPEMMFGGSLKNEFRLTSWNTVTEGNNIITIPAGEMKIQYWPLSEMNPVELYSNASDIEIKFSYKDGVVGAYDDNEGQGGGSTSSEVVLFEAGVTPTSSGVELNLSVGGVTMTTVSSGPASFKPSITAACMNLYPMNKITISAERNIKKVEFTNQSATTELGTKSLTEGSFASNTWTGDTKSFTIAFSNANVYLTKIVVTLTDDTTTGISSVNTTAGAVMYNIAGQKINKANGIVIVNGKKYFVK